MAEYIISKLDGKKYCVTNGHFNRHLKSHGLEYQDYYEKYVTGVQLPCPYCTTRRKWDTSRSAYSQTCGTKSCAGKAVRYAHLNRNIEDIAESNKQRKTTNLEKYGVESISAVDEVKQKVRLANERIVKDGMTSKQVQQEKTRKTKLEKYGDEFFNNAEEIRQSKALHTNDMKDQIHRKRCATNLEKFGVENCFLLSKAKHASGKGNAAVREFCFPSGKKVMIQGYEDKAIIKLLETYSEDDLIISDAANMEHCGAPIFKYINSANRENKTYFPDIYIKSEHKIVEVKSPWWYDGNGSEKYKGRLENNRRKRQAAIDAGYSFEFWIYRNDGKVLEVIR